MGGRGRFEADMVSATKKLTGKALHGLRWIKARQPVCGFPGDGPTPAMRKRLERRGLVEVVPMPDGYVGMARYRVTAAGEAHL